MSLLSRNVVRTLIQASSRNFHATASLNAAKPEGRTTCTLIPGDGVGPELIYSVQEVFKAISVPVDFEPFFLSEVNPALSSPLEDVVASIRKKQDLFERNFSNS